MFSSSDSDVSYFDTFSSAGGTLEVLFRLRVIALDDVAVVLSMFSIFVVPSSSRSISFSSIGAAHSKVVNCVALKSDGGEELKIK